MNTSRELIKKIVYKVFGKKNYQSAYVKGKIKDIENGVLDEKESQFLKYFIKEDSTVLDIGANYGHYSVDMSKICSNGKVYAFEPVPFTFQVLEKIISHFKLDLVELYHAAVSSREGEITMTLPLLDYGAPNTGVAFIGEEKGEKLEHVMVKTMNIDSLSLEGQLDFIKIDIEGHEPEAFQGMEKTLRKHNPVILIEFSYSCLKRAGFNPNEFSDKLKNKYGYVFTAINNDRLELVKDEYPQDGYYFLIPSNKLVNFNAIITE